MYLKNMHLKNMQFPVRHLYLNKTVCYFLNKNKLTHNNMDQSQMRERRQTQKNTQLL